MKLLPCPWCGKKPAILTMETNSWVACESSECPANPQIEARTRAAAIETWNTRRPAVSSGQEAAA
jgi:hypothetical protein